MRSTRFIVERLVVDGRDLGVHGCSLVVARSDPRPGEPGPVDWEVIATTRPGPRLPRAPVQVEIRTAEGRTLAGAALVVRSDGHGHVLRGGGPLAGFASTELDDPPPRPS